MKIVLTYAKNCRGLWYIDIDNEAAGIIHYTISEIRYLGKGKSGQSGSFIDAVNIIEKQFLTNRR